MPGCPRRHVPDTTKFEDCTSAGFPVVLVPIFGNSKSEGHLIDIASLCSYKSLAAVMLARLALIKGRRQESILASYSSFEPSPSRHWNGYIIGTSTSPLHPVPASDHFVVFETVVYMGLWENHTQAHDLPPSLPLRQLGLSRSSANLTSLLMVIIITSTVFIGWPCVQTSDGLVPTIDGS